MSASAPVPSPSRRMAIACGGTGGHLFPGLAVAEALSRRGADVCLLISPKEIDQLAARSAQASGFSFQTLPAIGLSGGNWLSFLRGFGRSFRQSHCWFRTWPPDAVLGMGGFTSAPPILAAKARGAATVLHESNAIPGRANRWLAPWVDRAFVVFPMAQSRLCHARVEVGGMPVRAQFVPQEPASCRLMLGLEASSPVLLVTGGSQGAEALNGLVVQALPRLQAQCPQLQYIHLTGISQRDQVQRAYARQQLRAVVRPFLSEMEVAMGAATLALSRAGGSSLAELAAMRLPSLLVPYPAAADNHQYFNAQALADSGAARVLIQKTTTAADLASEIIPLIQDEPRRQAMSSAIGRWHAPGAAEAIADGVWKARLNHGDSAANSPEVRLPAIANRRSDYCPPCRTA